MKTTSPSVRLPRFFRQGCDILCPTLPQAVKLSFYLLSGLEPAVRSNLIFHRLLCSESMKEQASLPFCLTSGKSVFQFESSARVYPKQVQPQDQPCPFRAPWLRNLRSTAHDLRFLKDGPTPISFLIILVFSHRKFK